MVKLPQLFISCSDELMGDPLAPGEQANTHEIILNS